MPKIRITGTPEMQMGGNKGKTNPLIYTDNPNDPRLRAYNDSLGLYNLNPLLHKGVIAASNRILGNGNYEDSHSYFTNIEKAEKLRNDLAKIKKYDNPISDYDPIVSQKIEAARNTGSNTAKRLRGDIYAKPVQPIEYRRPQVQMQQVPIGQFNMPVNNSMQQMQQMDVQNPLQDQLTGNPFFNTTGKSPEWYGNGFQNGGQVNMKKIRIISTPDMDNNTVMANGGYANQGATRKYGDQQTGQGYALDRFWSSPAGYPGSTSKINPYAKTGNTLPEAKDGGDINAEKQEMVLGDFDQDGQQELMNVNGKPHTEGGKDINVPSNSFVFSDTKALRVKDSNILGMFNMKPKKGGYTPAEIAKKYDLNKLKRILDDPKADEFSKKTAQLMNDNYLAKLNKLAAVQEGMKKQMGMEHHDPNQPKGQQQSQQQEPEVQEAGNMGPGGENMMQPEVMAQYGGEIPKYQYAGIGPRTEEEEDLNTVANQQVAQSVPPVYNMYSNNGAYPDDVQRGRQLAFNTTNTDMYGNNNYLDPNSRLNARSLVTSSYPGVSPELMGPTINAGSVYKKPVTQDDYDQMFNNIHSQAIQNPNLKRGVDYGSDYISFPLAKDIMKAKGVPDDMQNPEGWNKWVGQNIGNATQLKGTGIKPFEWGIRDTRAMPPIQLGRQQDQLQPVPIQQFHMPVTPNEQGMTPYPVTPPSFGGNNDSGTWTGNTLRKIGKGIKKAGAQIDPNFYGNIVNALQIAGLKKFRAYEPPVQAVIPETVFADYTAQAAAAQEAARSAGEGDVGSIGRAMSLARQGESLKPVREAIANTQAQNVGIANAANAQAAQITNELMAKQANRLAELNKAGFLADRDYQREMGKAFATDIQSKNEQLKAAADRSAVNMQSRYRKMDANGFWHWNGPNAEALFYKDLEQGAGAGFATRVKDLHTQGYTVDQAIEIAHGEQGRTRTQYGPTGALQKTVVNTQYGGYQMQYGGNHMAMPQMAPQYQTGGNNKRSNLKKFIK